VGKKWDDQPGQTVGEPTDNRVGLLAGGWVKYYEIGKREKGN